jgi:leucyl aminopeptidase
MATIKLSNAHILDQKCDSIAFIVEQDFAISDDIKAVEERVFRALSGAMKKQEFTGAKKSSLTVSASHNDRVLDIIFVGLGAENLDKTVNLETYRRALGSVIRIVESNRSKTVAIQLPDAALFGLSEKELARQTTVTIRMALYHFDTFITDKSRKIKDLTEVTLVTNSIALQDMQKGLEEGLVIADAVNDCRHWIDLPPEQLTPMQLGDLAQTIAKTHGLKITRFSEEEVCNMGMGGLCGVSKGSERDCQLVIMEYHGKAGAPTLGFVGKGITFDSGGLSLKPAVHMETMKEDMSGAAAVISAMKAIAQLKPEINIIAVTPISENLPSGKATKPGDILTFYNGKTAEVKNTDAEGRLILADALSYIVRHYELDALIDLATLTGACAYALGPHYSGMMSQHDDFVKQVEQAARISGDKVWRLPLPDDYKVAIRSTVADICNIGNSKYQAGATTAALFLQNFVGDVPWVHLDIAGSAYNVPDISYFRHDSATGVGVRLLIELAERWPAKK